MSNSAEKNPGRLLFNIDYVNGVKQTVTANTIGGALAKGESYAPVFAVTYVGPAQEPTELEGDLFDEYQDGSTLMFSPEQDPSFPFLVEYPTDEQFAGKTVWAEQRFATKAQAQAYLAAAGKVRI